MASQHDRAPAQLAALIAAAAVIAGLWWGLQSEQTDVSDAPVDEVVSEPAEAAPAQPDLDGSGSADELETDVYDVDSDAPLTLAEVQANQQAADAPGSTSSGRDPAHPADAVGEMMNLFAGPNEEGLAHLQRLEERIEYLEDADDLSADEAEELDMARYYRDEIDALLDESFLLQDRVLSAMQADAAP